MIKKDASPAYLGLLGMVLIAVIVALVVAGTNKDPYDAPEVSQGPVQSASQAAPNGDPACYVEGLGHLVPATCNSPEAWPWCPTEDAPMHAGQPCFWRDPQGRGLLWSDGINDEK